MINDDDEDKVDGASAGVAHPVFVQAQDLNSNAKCELHNLEIVASSCSQGPYATI